MARATGGLRAADWRGAGAVAAVSAAAYLLTGSRQYDPDVLQELELVQALDYSYPSPAHMLYSRLGAAIRELLLAVGLPVDALTVMQTVNACAGGLGLGAAFLLLRTLGVQALRSIAWVTFIGFGYAAWTHTVDAFFIAPAAGTALIALFCAVRLSEADASTAVGRESLALVMAFSVSVLCFQNNLAIVPALLLASWPGRDLAQVWLRRWVAIGGSVAALCLVAWAWQAWWYAGVDTLAGFRDWFLFGHGGAKNGLWRREGIGYLRPLVLGWTGTVLPVERGLRLSELLDGQFGFPHVIAQVALAAVGAIGLFAVAGLVVYRRAVTAAVPWHIWAALAAWVLLPGALVTWFDRAEIKLWLIPMMAVWLTVALAVELLIARSSPRVRSLARVAVPAVTALTVTANLLLAVYPDATTESPGLTNAREAMARVSQRDVLLILTFDWTSYSSFVCDDCRQIAALDLAQRVDPDERWRVRGQVLEEMRRTWSGGGRVLVSGRVLERSHVWSDWIEPYTGLRYDDIGSLRTTAIWERNGESLYAVAP